MNAFRRWVLLGVVLAASSWAVEFRRVGDLDVGSSTVEWLDPHRYVRVMNEWERSPDGKLKAVVFVVADVREQKLLRLPFALANFHHANPSLFNGPPNVSIVYFDGTTALLRFDRREPDRTIHQYALWDVQSQAVSEPKPLGGAKLTTVGGKLEVNEVTYLAGADPMGGRLYFAEATLDDKPRPYQGPLHIRFFRVTFPQLEQDWELELTLPKREYQLPAEIHRIFSPDGKRFALAEYFDRAAQRMFKPVPPPQVYVIDLEQKKIATYPIPSTPYGLAFSRDSRYLAVGSHEQNEIIRIDLEAGRIDRRVKAQSHLQGFVTSASGKWLIVLADHIGVPRSIEVRRWSDLGLQHTIPVSALFPGFAGIHPEGIRATADGRLLVSPRYASNGYPDAKKPGLVTFAIEEETGGAAADPIARVLPFAEKVGLRIYTYHQQYSGNAEGYFAPAAANAKGESFIIGTTNSLRDDEPYQPGKSEPHAIWVDANGKVVWSKSLRRGKTFVDYEGGSAVATPDGNFVVFVLAYRKPGSPATTQVLKVNRRGKVVWEWTGPMGKEARFPQSLQLLESGRVRMNGHAGQGSAPWVGELDTRTGKLVRDEVGAAK